MNDDFIYEKITGADLDWYAVDINGYLARMTTGGRGKVPYCYKISSWNYMFDYLENLPIISESIVYKQKQRLNFDDYIKMGNRGLYCFQADTCGYRPTDYVKYVTPSNPLKIESLDETIRNLLFSLSLPVLFANIMQLSSDFIIAPYCTCLPGQVCTCPTAKQNYLNIWSNL